MGIILSLAILLCWSSHLIFTLLYQELNPLAPEFWLHILVQTWLFTGLFITAHDAMHGTVSKYKAVNKITGFIATMLYAGMWYFTLVKKHRLHHQYSATAGDPDYFTGKQNFFVWWYSFMKQYLTLWQILIMAALFNVGLIFFSEAQLIVFWIIPAILSTFQLFYFGTYLPHRLPHSPEMQPYNSRSQKRNHLWAMLSCYFFGYHFEHHASPGTPWWQLYRLKDQKIQPLT